MPVAGARLILGSESSSVLKIPPATCGAGGGNKVRKGFIKCLRKLK